MQRAQREALEEQDQAVLVPPAEEEELLPDVGLSLRYEMPVDDERREFLVSSAQPLETEKAFTDDLDFGHFLSRLAL